MTFPARTDERDDFFCALHEFACVYKIGNIELIKLPNGLWYAHDGHGHRLNDMRMWIGRPASEHVPEWIADTSHAFRDLWDLLEDLGLACAPRLYRLPPAQRGQPVDTASAAAPDEAAPAPSPARPGSPEEGF